MSVIAAQQPGELALNLDFMGRVYLRIIGTIGRIEANHTVLSAKVLESGLFVADQCHHDVAVTGNVGALH